MSWCQCLSQFCHCRMVLVTTLVTLLFSLLLVFYTLLSSHHQILWYQLKENQIINSDGRVGNTQNKLYRIFSNEEGVLQELPYEGNSEGEPSDLHPCRVKVILSEVGHMGQNNDVISQCSKVIYNRVPKCGSRTVLGTFRALSSQLNYSLVSLEKPVRGRSFFSKTDELSSFVENFTEFESPLLYSQHLHYVDFTKFHQENPLYINVIRDPVERQISHYYYHMFGSSGQPKAITEDPVETIDSCMQSGTGFCVNLNAMLPFFCGQEKMCRSRTVAALKKAKRIASENVLVIGFTEDLSSFMEVLEFILPTYFFNASNVFNDISVSRYNRTKTAYKPSVKPETIQKLRDHLSLEYDFYNFAKQRFYNLLQRVQRAKADLKLTPMYRNKRNFYKWWKRTEKERS